MAENKDYTAGYFFVVWCAILLAYYWGQQVLKNILAATAAGSTADWWVDRDGSAPPAAWMAFWRSLTTSLGAVAFGSFFVAPLQTTVCVTRNVKTCVFLYHRQPFHPARLFGPSGGPLFTVGCSPGAREWFALV